MPTLRDKICPRCGFVTKNTASRGILCNRCSADDRFAEGTKLDLEILSKLYINIKHAGLSKIGKTIWTFTHEECGTEQTWVMANIKGRLKKDPFNVPCSKCGAHRRTSAATAAWVEKYGRTYDFQLLLDYTYKVRLLTESTYRKYKDVINPLGLQRALGNAGYHLDHIMPIHYGFMNGIPYEEIAKKENLQMMKGFDNISKGRRYE